MEKGNKKGKEIIPEKIPLTEKDKIEIKKNAMDTILEKGVDFTITVQKKDILNKLHFIPTERKFTIYPISMGALLQISKLLLDLDIDKLTAIMKEGKKEINILGLAADSIVENKDKMISIIAYGITNDEKEPSKRLIKFLNNNLTTRGGLKIITLIVQQMNVSPFLASLASVKGINLIPKKKI